MFQVDAFLVLANDQVHIAENIAVVSRDDLKKRHSSVVCRSHVQVVDADWLRIVEPRFLILDGNVTVIVVDLNATTTNRRGNQLATSATFQFYQYRRHRTFMRSEAEKKSKECIDIDINFLR